MKRCANVRSDVRAQLEWIGRERALIYKALVLTGLRKGELASLTVGQLDLDGPREGVALVHGVLARGLRELVDERVGEALDAWYGSLPLYFFVIFGPAIAGAALAVIFVREFERRARAAEAVRTLKATKPEKARLLVRLADAERRATEAERARREFVGHMSHELRTPLNAIIVFSEVI